MFLCENYHGEKVFPCYNYYGKITLCKKNRGGDLWNFKCQFLYDQFNSVLFFLCSGF